MTFFIWRWIHSAPPSITLSPSLSLSPSRSLPISLCLSLCHSQPITGWLQVFNPRPHHQLAHYIAALNLSLLPSSSPFLSLLFSFSLCQLCFWLCISFVQIFPVIITYVLLSLSPSSSLSLFILIWPFSLIFCCLVFALSSSLSSPHLQHPSFSLSTVSLSPSPLWPPHPANCYNSIVPSLPVGSDGINKVGFEIDFLSAPFWITLLRGFGSKHSSSCCL